jgi:hypothetical protein
MKQLNNKIKFLFSRDIKNLCKKSKEFAHHVKLFVDFIKIIEWVIDILDTIKDLLLVL